MIKKNNSAIGLLYDGVSSPTVTVKGFGEFAEEIISLAHENGVLVHQDEMLAKTLEKLELGQEIPKELYILIAELIAFSYVLKGEFPPGWQAVAGKLNTKA